MKITPKNADEYFHDTEHAMKRAYAGLDSCMWHVQEALSYKRPVIEKDGMVHYAPAKTPEEKAKMTRSLELLRQYGELRRFSEATFAGSILLTAYMAIKLFSPPRAVIPASCAPTGLIIYAGRNQYAHWDAERLYEINEWVFEKLYDAFSDNPLSDLTFDFRNPTINIYAGELLLVALGWYSYEIYLAEMKQLLS